MESPAPPLLLTELPDSLVRLRGRRRIVCIDADCALAAVARRADLHLRNEAGRRPLILLHDHGGRRRVAGCCALARRRGVYPGLREQAARIRVRDARFAAAPEPLVFRDVFAAILLDLQGLSPAVEQEGGDGFFLDMTGCARLSGNDLPAWTRRLCAWLERRWGVAFSGGVGTNKMVARLAMRAAKWGHVCAVEPGWEEGFMAGVPVYRLPGVGAVLGRRLEECGLRRAGHLAALGAEGCRDVAGPAGRALWRRACGLCEEPVAPTRLHDWLEARQDLPAPTADPLVLDSLLVACVERLLALLRHHRVIPGRAELAIRYGDGATAQAAITPPPGSLLDPDWIAAARRAWGRAHTRRVAIKSIELRSPIEPAQALPPDLLETERQHRRSGLYRTIDQIRDRHGRNGLRSASSLIQPAPHKSLRHPE